MDEDQVPERLLHPDVAAKVSHRQAVMFRNTVILLLFAQLVLVITFAVGGYIAVHQAIENGRRTLCSTELLAGPWIGLRKTLEAPLGDPNARVEANAEIEAAITKLRRVKKICA